MAKVPSHLQSSVILSGWVLPLRLERQEGEQGKGEGSTGSLNELWPGLRIPGLSPVTTQWPHRKQQVRVVGIRRTPTEMHSYINKRQKIFSQTKCLVRTILPVWWEAMKEKTEKLYHYFFSPCSLQDEIFLIAKSFVLKTNLVIFKLFVTFHTLIFNRAVWKNNELHYIITHFTFITLSLKTGY